jgi:hypothetical protein
MKAVSLAEGDPTWVFPEQSVTPALMASLEMASGKLVEIAGLLVYGRAGWTGSGLEYNLFPPSGICHLYGWAENPQVCFIAELAPPDRKRAGWEVSADIEVSCDSEVRSACGMHLVEEFTQDTFDRPEDAVAALQRATDWLLARCRAVPPEQWRARDPMSGHD